MTTCRSERWFWRVLEFLFKAAVLVGSVLFIVLLGIVWLASNTKT